jgi:hypothetical protein
MMQLIQIVYQPRMENPVVVATFDDIDEAQEHMAEIKATRPKAAKHHEIVISEITTQTEWLWADSGIEQGL